MMARLNNSDVRSNESPMDFEWGNTHGPIPKDSPWTQPTMNGRKYNTFAGIGHKSQYSYHVHLRLHGIILLMAK